MVAVRWYLRYGLSYRDVEELLAERGIAVDQSTTSPPQQVDAAPAAASPDATCGAAEPSPARYGTKSAAATRRVRR